jgi:hypothetical protein
LVGAFKRAVRTEVGMLCASYVISPRMHVSSCSRKTCTMSIPLISLLLKAREICIGIYRERRMQGKCHLQSLWASSELCFSPTGEPIFDSFIEQKCFPAISFSKTSSRSLSGPRGRLSCDVSLCSWTPNERSARQSVVARTGMARVSVSSARAFHAAKAPGLKRAMRLGWMRIRSRSQMLSTWVTDE